tara:strand:- start:31 stop:681 length:651 start_codon:yes stop_codon:yes gene_type:complete
MLFKKVEEESYVSIAERIQEFRESEKYKGFTIQTNVDDFGVYIEGEKPKYALLSAAIINNEGKAVATGHALEIEGTSDVNKTSFLENAETSAVGRALGFLGIKSKGAVASKDEVVEAKSQQKVANKKETIAKGKKLTEQAKKGTELDLSFVTGKKTKGALESIKKGMVAMGVTKPLLMLRFKDFDKDGKYQTFDNFLAVATEGEIKIFLTNLISSK